MAKSLDELKHQLQVRMDELRPRVDEYRQLEQAATALGIGSDTPSPRAAPRPAASAGQRAPRGANKTAIFDVIRRRPGVTVGEIADATGVAKPLIYNTTRTGVDRGELEPVDLGGGRKGFSVAGGGDQRPAEDEPPAGASLEEGAAGIEDPDEPAPVGG